MSKSRFFCGGSVLAVTLAVALGAAPGIAIAQQPVQTAAAQPPEDEAVSEVEEIISTGTFIRGTAEDTALPVEVIGRAELLQQGNPTVEELVRNLSEIGFVQSQSARGTNAGGIGVSSLNLRNLGSGRTLITLNGRRLADDPNTNGGGINVTGGAQQNLNAIPTGALQQVEILKDTGAASYGSDAVAGVVNFITRRDLNGTELDVSYKYINGSDGGNYDANLRWGRRNDRGNVLVSLEYLHSSLIDAAEIANVERDKANPDLGFGTSIGETINNDVGGYQFVLAGGTTAITPTGTGNNLYLGGPNLAQNGYPVTAAFGSGSRLFPVMGATGIMRDDACAAIGGYKVFSTTPSPGCGHRRADSEPIEYAIDTYRVFSDINFDLTDKIRYHAEVLFNKQVTFIPGQDNGAGPAPCDPLPDNAPGAATATPRACTQVSMNAVGGSWSVPGYNPAVYDYMMKSWTNPINGSASQRVFTDAQISSITGQNIAGAFQLAATTALTTDQATRAGIQNGASVGQGFAPNGFGRMTLPISVFQPFVAHFLEGFDTGQAQYKNESLNFRTTQQFKGDLGEVFGTVIDYDISATYSRNMTRLYGTAWNVDRLQRAMNGFATNLDDLGSDGLGCTTAETTGSRTYGTGATAVTLQVPYTVGAGGGADYDPSTPGAQRAPNGFNPGTSAGNNCYFVNVFSSAISKSLLNDQQPLASPTDVGFVGGVNNGGTASDYQGYASGYGLGNPAGIMRWIFQQREQRVTSDNINIDAVINGQIPKYELWGGPVSWALGGQSRYVNRVSDIDFLSDRRINPCQFQATVGGNNGTVNNTINTTSTCSNTDGLFQTNLGPTGDPYRETQTYAAFGEFNLPITDRLNAQVIVRNERTKLPGNDEFIAETVWSGSGKYKITDQLSMHASVAQHFDTPTLDPPGQDVVQPFAYTGGVVADVNPANRSISINNVDLSPETGTNWSVGLDFVSPDRRWNASLDFYSVTVTGRPAAITASTIARAALGIRTAGAPIPANAFIDCAAPLGAGTVADLFDPAFAPAIFDGKPFIEFIDASGNITRGCRNNAQLGGVDIDGVDANGDGLAYNDPLDLGLSFTTPNRVNGGNEKAQGIEAGLTYRVPELVFGGNLTLDSDFTVNLVKTRSDVIVFGINVTDGNDDIGTLPPDTFSLTNIIRGSIGANYVRGKHMFNVRGVFVGGFADQQNMVFVPWNIPVSNTTNLNPLDPNACTAVGLPSAALPIPIGAPAQMLGSDLLVGDLPFNRDCNLQTNRGKKVGNSFAVNATYRLQLPQDTTLVFTVDNLLDRNPPYWRATYHYIPFGSATPYGRTFKVAVQKKF